MVRKEKFAKLYVQESMIYDLCHNKKYENIVDEKINEIRSISKKINDEINKSILDLPTTLNISFIGFCDNDNILHSDIDDKLVEIFDDNIRVDSEGSAFRCYCNSSYKDKISKFLKENYPDLNFSTNIDEDPQNPWFGNWGDAKKYCEENNIKVELPKEIKSLIDSYNDSLNDGLVWFNSLSDEKKEYVKELSKSGMFD